MINMNKPFVMVITSIVLMMGTSFIVPSIPSAFAQYVGGDAAPAAGNLDEQLALAEGKVASAKQAGAYGSGTAMLGSDLTPTLIMVGIVVAIFGGVAIAFFAMGRGKQQETKTY